MAKKRDLYNLLGLSKPLLSPLHLLKHTVKSLLNLSKV